MIKTDQVLRKLLEFLDNHWLTLQTQGLFVQGSRWMMNPGESQRARRLRDFLILRTLQTDDDLRFLRRAVMLLRNLENFEVFHREAAHLRSSGRQPRFKNETDKHVAYNEYLAHIYTDNMPTDTRKARRALIDDLRFARRWLILTTSLTTGAILVCGEWVFKKLSVNVSNILRPYTDNFAIFRTPIIRAPSLTIWSSLFRAHIQKIVTVCRILQPYAESLISTERIPHDANLQDLKRDIREAQGELFKRPDVLVATAYQQ